jgi:hypothetical protein
VQMIPTALTEIRDAIENVRAQRQSPPEDEP